MVNNILDLPLEILALIFEELIPYGDKKNFARAHPKLKEAIYHTRKDVETEMLFDLHDEYDEVWDFLLEWWGPTLKRIDHINDFVDCEYLMELVVKYCPKLEILKIDVENDMEIEENLLKLKCLKELHIYNLHQVNCRDIYSSIHKLIESLQNLPNLRHLMLHFDCELLNERISLNKLIQLEVLEFYEIKPEHVIDLTDVLRNLRELKICKTDTITLGHFPEHCLKLQKLHLESYKSISSLPYFPALTELRLGTNRYDHISHLVRHLYRYTNQLQVLDIQNLRVNKTKLVYITTLKALTTLICWRINSECITEITQMSLEKISTRDLNTADNLRLVKECSTLRELTFDMQSFDKKFLPELFVILKRRGFQPDHPFQYTIRISYPNARIFHSEIASVPYSNLLNVHYENF